MWGILRARQRYSNLCKVILPSESPNVAAEVNIPSPCGGPFVCTINKGLVHVVIIGASDSVSSYFQSCWCSICVAFILFSRSGQYIERQPPTESQPEILGRSVQKWMDCELGTQVISGRTSKGYLIWRSGPGRYNSHLTEPFAWEGKLQLQIPVRWSCSWEWNHKRPFLANCGGARTVWNRNRYTHTAQQRWVTGEPAVSRRPV